MKLNTLIIPVLLMLTACSEFQYYSSTGVAPVTSKGYGADYWLAELHETRAMTPEQRQVTLGLWKQEYDNDPHTGSRIRLALLLATGDESIRDLAYARELLDGISPEPDSVSDRELITLVRQFIDKVLETETTISDLRKLTQKKNKQIEELEQQQQALTNIEQNNQQRDSQPESPGTGSQ